jgi:hypothetical protein
MTVRAVLRGVPLADGAISMVRDVKLIVIARAKAADWPDVELEPGDLETITWSTPAESAAVATTLLASERVISVRVESAEGG